MIMPGMTAPVMSLIQGSAMPLVLVMVPVMLFAMSLVVVAMVCMSATGLDG
jgi:hypothetical protein